RMPTSVTRPTPRPARTSVDAHQAQSPAGLQGVGHERREREAERARIHDGDAYRVDDVIVLLAPALDAALAREGDLAIAQRQPDAQVDAFAPVVAHDGVELPGAGHGVAGAQ